MRKIKEETNITVMFRKPDGNYEGVTITALSKNQFFQKVKIEAERRGLDYLDYNDVQFLGNHKWINENKEKIMKKEIIEIKADVKINKNIILEKGDKIKFLEAQDYSGRKLNFIDDWYIGTATGTTVKISSGIYMINSFDDGNTYFMFKDYADPGYLIPAYELESVLESGHVTLED